MGACAAQDRMVWFSIMLEAPRPWRTDAQRTCGIVLPPALSCSSKAARERRSLPHLGRLRGRPGRGTRATERFVQPIPQRAVSWQQQRDAPDQHRPTLLRRYSCTRPPALFLICGLFSSDHFLPGSKRADSEDGGWPPGRVPSFIGSTESHCKGQGPGGLCQPARHRR